MTSPTTPAQATFPIPPPAPNMPWVERGPMGELILTPNAFEFLQLLWAAVQGQGGMVDVVGDVAIGLGATNANVLALLSGQGSAMTFLVPPQNPAALLQSLSLTIVLNEVPAGAVDGVNTVYTLAFTPTSAGVALFLNGLLQKPGLDYTLAGTTITMVAAPLATDLLLANYNR